MAVSSSSAASSSSSSSRVNLQGAIDKGFKIREFIEGRKPDNARELAHELCKDAFAMIVAELSNKPLIPDDKNVQPIVVDLQKALSDPAFHGDLSLNRTISKICRIFVELSWYQAWRISVNQKEKVRVSDDFRNALIDTVKILKKILQGRTNTTGARFELRCAKQGAKRFEPTTSVWETYSFHVADLLAAGGDRSATAIWTALKRLGEDLKRDCPLNWKLWYQSVHVLRWEATRVHTVENFEAKVAPNIELCREQGDNFSLCLTKIFMELIKRDDVDQAVKDRAFRGTDEGQEGLIHLITWQRPGTAKDAFKHPSEIFHKIARKADRFWETRDLATRYLAKIATKDKEEYASYREESRAALKSRSEVLETKESARYNTEKRRLQVILRELEERHENLEDELADIGEELIAIEPSRAAGSVDEEKRKTLEEKGEALEKEYDQLEEQISENRGAIRLQDVFLQIAKEEKQLIDSFLDG